MHLLSLAPPGSPPRLARISAKESENQMSISNLAIVFGPTLFGISGGGAPGASNGMADATLQNKVRS